MPSTTGPVNVANPFRLRTSLDGVIEHPSWQRARDASLAALSAGGSVAILGDPGTGKSMLLRRLGADLQADGQTVRTINGSLPLPEESEIDPDAVAVVDEADRVPVLILGPLLGVARPFLLAALPDFEACLAVMPQLVVPVRLDPLSPQDVALVLAARLSEANLPRIVFEAEAVLAIARQSRGVIRLALMLAGSAWFLARQEDATRVAPRHVTEAASMHDIKSASPSDEAAAAAKTTPDETRAWPAPPTNATIPIATPISEPALRSKRRIDRRAAITAAAAAGVGAIAVLWAATRQWRLILSTQEAHRIGPDSVRRSPQADPGGSAAVTDAPAPAVQRPEPSPTQVQREQPDSPLDTQRSQGLGPSFREPHPPLILPHGTATYRGPVHNQTLNRSGMLSLTIRQSGAKGDAVTVQFRAWAGLIGTGNLSGTLLSAGDVSLSGRLMMGRNAFDTILTARILGRQLTGAATFERADRPSPPSRCTFTLEQV